MINQIQKRVLILAVRAAEIMMKSGAEIYRVEDTITRICHACRIPYVEVFATPTGVFVTIGSGGPNGDVETYVKRIHGSETDLTKISKVNDFSRVFTNTDLSVEDGMEIISPITSQIYRRKTSAVPRCRKRSCITVGKDPHSGFQKGKSVFSHSSA